MAIELSGGAYLILPQKLLTAFPCTTLEMVSWDASTDAHAFSQQDSAANHAISMGFLANSSQFVAVNNPGNTVLAIKNAAPVPNTTQRWMMAVWTSATSRTCYYGSATGVTDTAAGIDDLFNHNRIMVGGIGKDGATPTGNLVGKVAELHLYNGVALTSADFTSVLGGTLPETIAGCTASFPFRNITDLSSMDGAYTFTAVGTISNATHPISRTSGATVTMTGSNTSGSSTSTTGSMTVTPASGTTKVMTGSNTSGASTSSTGSMTVTAAGTGTITSDAYTAYGSNAPLVGLTVPKVVILRVSDGATILTLSNQVTNGAGRLVTNHAALVAGTWYMQAGWDPAAPLTSRGFKAYLAS